LRESLRPLVVDVERFRTSPRDGHVSAAVEHDTHALRAAGMWGGSSELDRMQVAHLPVEVAAETLERSFPERLRQVVAAFRVNGSRSAPQSRSRAARAARMLEEQQVAAVVAVTGPRRCEGCGERLPALARSDARYCSVRCRVAAHRARAA
jgi:hypothetical protein